MLSKKDVQHRLQCDFVKKWRGLVEDSRKCLLYKYVKTEFMLESYLYKSSNGIWKYVVKIRCSYHKLSIEKGRYNRIDRNLRYVVAHSWTLCVIVTCARRKHAHGQTNSKPTVSSSPSTEDIRRV